MAIRDDYILRFLNLMREALAESVRHREAGRYEQALLAVLRAQEKLFLRPPEGFMSLTLDEQLALLSLGEDASTSRSKRLAYGSLLREAGMTYAKLGRDELGISAFQLALQVQLTVALADSATDAELVSSMRDLLSRIPPEALQPPVIEQLERMPHLLQTGPS